MDVSDYLRKEIMRRGFTPTDVSRATGLPFSTVSEFVRGVREVGTDKASAIAEFLGLSLVYGNSRRLAMQKYERTVAELEKKGVDVDDETMERLNNYVANLEWLDRKDDYPPTDEEAEKLENYVENYRYLQREKHDLPDDEKAEWLENCVENYRYLQREGYDFQDDDEMEKVEAFVQNLRWLEEHDEIPDEDRMNEVAEFVANLEQMEE